MAAQQEPLKANHDPQNQAAKRLLEQVDAEQDPKLLYVLQLMRWALVEGELPGAEPAEEYLLSELEVGDQEEAWKELTQPEYGGQIMNLPQENPASAASEMWEIIRALT